MFNAVLSGSMTCFPLKVTFVVTNKLTNNKSLTHAISREEEEGEGEEEGGRESGEKDTLPLTSLTSQTYSLGNGR